MKREEKGRSPNSNRYKKPYKGFAKSKEPYILIPAKDFIEFLFELNGVKVKTRKPTKEEIKFAQENGDPTPFFVMEKAESKKEKVKYLA